MNDQSWKKYLDSAIEQGLLKDPTALAVIVYLLNESDKEGNVLMTRFSAASQLGMKPSTFYKTLSRVTMKYQSGSSHSNNGATLFQFNRTLQDGTGEVSGSRSGNSLVTMKEQPRGVSSSPSSLPPITPNTLSTPVSSEILPRARKKYSALEDVTQEDMQHIADDYRVALGRVKFSYETLKNYCGSKGKTYKDYKAALRNFVLSDMKRTLEGRDNDRRAIDASQV